MKITKTILVLLTVLGMGSFSHAEETTGEKAGAAATRAKNTVKETYRNAKNEICELVNGKMKCVAQKVKHSAQNAADAAEAKAKELKNKVD